MKKQIIWVYTLCYNESHFVGNFLTAYKEADRIIVYDNYSTDNSVELLQQDPRVEIRYYDSYDKIRDDLYLKVKNNCWKEARGKADWVIVVDFDEVFTRMEKTDDQVTIDLDLSYSFDAGYNIIKPYGYNMISVDAPLHTSDHPWVYSKKGTYHPPEDKMCCFRPDQISEINFDPGCHTANPLDMNGKKAGIKIYNTKEYKMLHFKAWNFDLYMERAELYTKRMSEINIRMGWAFQYMHTMEQQRSMFMAGVNLAKFIFDIEV
jgi:glycosyltransferase involved in cell wall biosynthesis